MTRLEQIEHVVGNLRNSVVIGCERRGVFNPPKMGRSLMVTSVIRMLWVGAFALLSASTAHAQACPVTPDSDALRQIVQCLAGQDCRRRTVVESENLGAGCDNQIEVWAWHANRRSVAIRDRKMCLSRRKSAPDPAFVHGLLLPMTPLCGVEDPQLYLAGAAAASLWQDAWEAARARLPEHQITLAINPPTLRSQTHLHIHIVRGNDRPFPATEVMSLDNLAGVWQAADAVARDRPTMSGRNYGIAIRKRGERFDMLVEAGAPANSRNPESRYGIDED